MAAVLQTVADVNKVAVRLKTAIAPMSWAKKPNRETHEWREFFSALEFVDDRTQTPEQLFIRCTWRQQTGDIPESWTFALWNLGERVFATDFQPVSRHKNNAGKGRPLYGQWIKGMHIHTWSDDGYGYAELMSQTEVPEGQQAWEIFCKMAGIVPSEFVHPDKSINDGQAVFRF